MSVAVGTPLQSPGRSLPFSKSPRAVSTGIAKSQKTHIQALIRLEVACHVALDALPELPDDTEQALRDHVQTLCEVAGAELDRIKPGWRERLAAM
jgi:hypothetical protein